LTSAYANIDNLQHAINDAAIYRFVPKPWNLDELCAAMQDALLVERSANEVAEPAIGPISGGDAEEASLALLAILASGFDAPLASLDSEALELSQLGNQPSLQATPISTTYMSSWSSRLRQAKVATSAIQVRRDVEHCKSLAKSIKTLASSLANPAAVPSSSMADTLWEVIAQNSAPAASQPSVDATQDFTYRVPREIMKFVLANVLRGDGSAEPKDRPVFSKIELYTGSGHNEIRFTLDAEHSALALDDRAWRTVRSSLWAFGGELLTSADQKDGTRALILCLPKAA
jgi:two-component system probable response regulator PhcQ